jgi:mannose-6-phosphate isomerase-like protein (cupin superfamily)
MMGLQVHKGFFQSKAEVLEDIRKNDTWPSTFVSGASEGLPIHWHSEEVHGYVIEGETDFLDAETDERIPLGPGDKIVIPARTLHAEGEVRDRVVYILALPLPLPPDDFLVVRPPEDL